MLTLGDSQLLNTNCQNEIFKSYTLFKCLQTVSRLNQWTFKEDERDNPHSIVRDTGMVYQIEVYDNQNVQKF